MSTTDRGLHDDTWKLIQPELLSPSELLQILKERQITVEDTEISNKNRLVELFKRVATPLPQRNRFVSSTNQQRNFKIGHNGKNTFNGTTQSAFDNKTININKTLPIICPNTRTIKLKRTSEAVQPNQGFSVQNDTGEPTAKKREKITWP